VLPRLNEEVNEEWISDKTRYAVDGLKRQRLDRPFIRRNGKLEPAAWDEALAAAAAALSKAPERIGAIAGDLACAESMKATLDLFRALGSPHVDCRPDGARIGAGPRQGYLFNTTIQGVEACNALLIVGANPRTEAPVLNARLRKAWLLGKMQVGLVGEAVDLTYSYDHLGAGPRTLAALAGGEGAFLDVLKKAERAAVIVGQGALARDDGAQVLRLAGRIAAATGMVQADWNGFNVLHTAAARVAGLDLGFLPSSGGLSAPDMVKAMDEGRLDTLVLLGVDETPLPAPGKGVVIYIGSHGDRGAHRADIILPGAAYTEKNATWVNTEGRVQFGRRATFPKGDAREDWAILRALSARLGKALPYDDLSALRVKLAADHPTFSGVDYAPGAYGAETFDPASLGADGAVGEAAFASPIEDFYLTNPIARASRTMADCSAQRLARGQAARTAAE
jgi:NADH-quinone oxidoreductase subunit G